jgi:hypothetical protein
MDGRGIAYGFPWVLVAVLGLIGFALFVAFVASMIRKTWRQFGPGQRRIDRTQPPW